MKNMTRVSLTRIFFLIYLLLITSSIRAQAPDYRTRVENYIRQYKTAAINEMALFKIPASITLAQGIIETGAGNSRLAREANNHFGIKCHREWTGMTYYQDDDEKNECFRKYKDPLESYRDHSHFLTSRERYKGLFSLDLMDYKGWAQGLKAAGYATNPKYPELLIKTIETYSLDQFDAFVLQNLASDTLQASEIALGSEVLRGFQLVCQGAGGRDIFINNGIRLIVARGDDNIYLIARDFKISIEKLLKYNDLAFATSLKPGQIVYLHQKKRKAAVRTHTFREGERLYDVAQQYGIRLKMIYKRNDLHDMIEPRPGMVLKLR